MLRKTTSAFFLESEMRCNFLKMSENKSNTNFFEAYILLALDNIKKNNIDSAIEILQKIPSKLQEDRLNYIIL